MSLFKNKQHSMGAYVKAVIKIFLPLGLGLCAVDVCADVTLDNEHLEAATKTVEQWIGRGTWVIAAGGLGISSYYGFIKNSWTDAIPGAVIGIGVPVVAKAMKASYTLLI